MAALLVPHFHLASKMVAQKKLSSTFPMDLGPGLGKDPPCNFRGHLCKVMFVTTLRLRLHSMNVTLYSEYLLRTHVHIFIQ